MSKQLKQNTMKKIRTYVRNTDSSYEIRNEETEEVYAVAKDNKLAETISSAIQTELNKTQYKTNN